MDEQTKQRIRGLRTETGRRLAMALVAQAFLVQDYSDDPNNPNVSAWLRGGAIEQIEKIEQEAQR